MRTPSSPGGDPPWLPVLTPDRPSPAVQSRSARPTPFTRWVSCWRHGSISPWIGDGKRDEHLSSTTSVLDLGFAEGRSTIVCLGVSTALASLRRSSRPGLPRCRLQQSLSAAASSLASASPLISFSRAATPDLLTLVEIGERSVLAALLFLQFGETSLNALQFGGELVDGRLLLREVASYDESLGRRSQVQPLSFSLPFLLSR